MPHIAVIGAGPAGLIAAEVAARAGASVVVYERMSSVARKFLLAGRGGLNLTHSEPSEAFGRRYGAAAWRMAPYLAAFSPADLQEWAAALGQSCFVGTSGRVFPQCFKTSPLLRAWLARLNALGVEFRLQHQWRGWAEDGALLFLDGKQEPVAIRAAASILALGGASWPRLGSDSGWVRLLEGQGIAVTPLRPANCGFRVNWSDHFRARFEGQPLKAVAIRFGTAAVRGELMITAEGLEGGAIYAMSAPLRDAVLSAGGADLVIDLKPDLTRQELATRLAMPRRGASRSNFLRKAAGLSAPAIGLLHEAGDLPEQPDALADHIKALALRLTGIAAIDRAISTAGGVAWDELDNDLMLRRLPGCFVAGEMLDWEAPTGGYLLQGAFSTGVAAAKGALRWLGGLSAQETATRACSV